MNVHLRMFFVIATLAIGVGTSGAAAEISSAEAAGRTRMEFRHPGKAYRPMVRWWWPGNDVDDVEIRREISELDAAGFGGAEIQSYSMNFDPSMPAERRARIYGYGTQSFFAHVRTAVDEARARGMWIDLSFGSGWPIGGGAAVTPERAVTELRYSEIPAKGGERFHSRLDLPVLGSQLGKRLSAMLGAPPWTHPPGWDDRLEARAKTIAIIAVRGSAPKLQAAAESGLAGNVPSVEVSGQLEPGVTVDLTSRLKPDGILEWNVPSGDWRILVFRQVAMNTGVIGAAAPGPALVLDHFQRPAFDVFAAQWGDPLSAALSDRFANGLRAVFCDSLEIPTDLYWSDDFLEEFASRRGYELAPFLPLIIQFGYNHPYNPATTRPLYDIPQIGDAVRRDYRKTVDELISERFYRPFADWASRHRLLSRIQAHGAPADLLHVYGLADIPETEQFFGGGTLDFLKMASSAADINGRRIVASESFVFRGDSYHVTPEQLKANSDKLIIAGVNQIVYHGYPYVYDDRPYPGWGPFNRGTRANFSVFMNGRNTFWPYVGAVNAYIARLQYVAQTGTTVTPLAVLVSRTGYDTSSVKNSPLTEGLMSAGYAFGYVNADAVLTGHVASQELEFVASGGARFSALLLNDVAWLDIKVAAALEAIARAGVPVLIIGRRPTVSASLENFDEESRLVRRAVSAIASTSNSMAVPTVESAIAALRELIAPNVRFPTGKPLPFIEKRLGSLTAILVVNPASQPVSTVLESTAQGAPEHWDPWTGETQSFTGVEITGAAKRLHLALPPYGSALLVFDPGRRPLSRGGAEFSPGPPMIVPLDSISWQLHAVGHDTEGRSVTIDRTFEKLTDWNGDEELKRFSGRGTYTATIELAADILRKGERISLDLGDVRDVAEVRVNGHAGLALLMRPYIADITKWVRDGRNTLEITVVNALSNAASPGAPMISTTGAEAAVVPTPYVPRSAGLIGPVNLKVGGREATVANGDSRD